MYYPKDFAKVSNHGSRSMQWHHIRSENLLPKLTLLSFPFIFSKPEDIESFASLPPAPSWMPDLHPVSGVSWSLDRQLGWRLKSVVFLPENRWSVRMFILTGSKIEHLLIVIVRFSPKWLLQLEEQPDFPWVPKSRWHQKPMHRTCYHHPISNDPRSCPLAKKNNFNMLYRYTWIVGCVNILAFSRVQVLYCI